MEKEVGKRKKPKNISRLVRSLVSFFFWLLGERYIYRASSAWRRTVLSPGICRPVCTHTHIQRHRPPSSPPPGTTHQEKKDVCVPFALPSNSHTGPRGDALRRRQRRPRIRSQHRQLRLVDARKRATRRAGLRNVVDRDRVGCQRRSVSQSAYHQPLPLYVSPSPSLSLSHTHTHTHTQTHTLTSVGGLERGAGEAETWFTYEAGMWSHRPAPSQRRTRPRP